MKYSIFRVFTKSKHSSIPLIHFSDQFLTPEPTPFNFYFPSTNLHFIQLLVESVILRTPRAFSDSPIQKAAFVMTVARLGCWWSGRTCQP